MLAEIAAVRSKNGFLEIPLTVADEPTPAGGTLKHVYPPIFTRSPALLLFLFPRRVPCPRLRGHVYTNIAKNPLCLTPPLLSFLFRQDTAELIFLSF